MKRIILPLLILYSLQGFGQVFVNDVNINELDIKYCQLFGFDTSPVGKKSLVMVDYGQKGEFTKSQSIKDSEGKDIDFNGMIDALNFMYKNGWELDDQYIIVAKNLLTNKEAPYEHFILKKKED